MTLTWSNPERLLALVERCDNLLKNTQDRENPFDDRKGYTGHEVIQIIRARSRRLFDALQRGETLEDAGRKETDACIFSKLDADENHILNEEGFLCDPEAQALVGYVLFDVESEKGLRLVVGDHGIATQEPTGKLERDTIRVWSVVSRKSPDGKEIAAVQDVTPTLQGMTGEELSLYLRDFDVVELLDVESHR